MNNYTLNSQLVLSAGASRRWKAIAGTADEELIEAIREAIIDRAGSPPSLPDLAGKLLLSPRTLRRRLHELNTCFSEIVAEVRENLVCEYLRGTSLSLEKIAEQVGYSDAANLRQAIKRWLGESPQRYRERMQSPIDRAAYLATSELTAI